MKSRDRSYIVAGCKSWNRHVFDDVISKYPGDWFYVDSPEAMLERLQTVNPRYIFFLHWSWIVPDEIIHAHECVCFHMTDVPYGRGGSPLQNLILRGHAETKLTALRMIHEPDAGPVYMKRPLSLAGSSAEEIYIRASRLSAEMIMEIMEKRPRLKPQKGRVTVFKRRRPSESEIPALGGLEALHDFIRMLDAEGYPHAFLQHKGFQIEFTGSSYSDGKLAVHAEIRKAGKK